MFKEIPKFPHQNNMRHRFLKYAECFYETRLPVWDMGWIAPVKSKLELRRDRLRLFRDKSLLPVTLTPNLFNTNLTGLSSTLI
jgi:hypothetical protein